MSKDILVAGGAGFIGSNFVAMAVERGHRVVVVDKLSYAGHKENLEDIKGPGSFEFFQGDINDTGLLADLLGRNSIEWLVNFAAESHVDRSISGPAPFIESNIVGVFNLLTQSLNYFKTLTPSQQKSFRYLQISTDEVYGQLGDTGHFTEHSAMKPNSPYAASKASADHLVRAWFHTYGLPTLTTNCSNNYGPKQYPEKLIPFMIRCALSDKPMGIYGNGQNVRDWIHVRDHCKGVFLALEKGTPGESYVFGGNSERNNVQVVTLIAQYLDELKPRADKKSYKEQVKFVADRPGHDFRYAIDDSFAQKMLGFRREWTFETGLKETVRWYLNNSEWMNAVLAKEKK